MKKNFFKKNNIVFSFLIIILLFTFSSCKYNDEHLAYTPEDNNSKTEINQQTNNSDKKNQNEVDIDAKMNEHPTVQCTLNNEKCQYIKLNYQDIEYYHYLDYPFISENVIFSKNIDTSLLKSTNLKVDVTYYKINETDEYVPTHTAEASIYTLPQELENNPYINIVAVMIEQQHDFTFFWSFKSQKEKDPFLNYLKQQEFVYGYNCTDVHSLLSIKISKSNSDNEYFVITDKPAIENFFERLIESKYYKSNDLYPKIQKGIYAIDLEFTDNSKFTFLYNADTGLIANTYKVTSEFEHYFLNIVKGG